MSSRRMGDAAQAYSNQDVLFTQGIACQAAGKQGVLEACRSQLPKKGTSSSEGLTKRVKSQNNFDLHLFHNGGFF